MKPSAHPGVGVIVALLMLASCQQGVSTTGQVASPPARASATAPQAASSEKPAEASGTPLPVEKPSTPGAKLVGLSEVDLNVLLGAPSAVLDEEPGKVYYYNDENCVLKAYLYLDLGASEFYVLDYDIVAATSADGRRTCRGYANGP